MATRKKASGPRRAGSGIGPLIRGDQVAQRTEEEDFRNAVIALQGVNRETLQTIDPSIIDKAKAWLKRATKEATRKALPAPAAVRRQPLKRSVWAKVADDVFGLADDVHYVIDQRTDRALRLAPIAEHRGRGRKPMTLREWDAKCLVIESAYAKAWKSFPRRASTQRKAAEIAARMIQEKYHVNVNAKTVEEHIKALPAGDRLALLSTDWSATKRKLQRLAKAGGRARVRRSKKSFLI